MPEGTTWLTFLLEHCRSTLAHNAWIIGNSFVLHKPPTWKSWEPLITAVLVGVVLILLSLRVRSRLSKTEEAVIPDDRLTLRTFMETFLGYFYDLAKGVMGPERAKQYFPIIGGSACFVFFSNVVALVPGFPVCTSSLSITAGSALVVFVLFNLYGLKENGWDYVKHLAGPVWYMMPLIFVIEVISLCVRPVTLAVRLMLNMAVDHLIVAIFLGLVGLVIPLPAMILTIVVVVVQTLVFALLTSIYIGLATEPAEHH